MIRPRAVIVAGAAILALVSAPAAQVRDARNAVAPNDGAIAGRVEVETEGQRAPVRRATITLTGTTGDQTRTAVSDADGRYRFESVAAGGYRLLADKPGFVATPVSIHVPPPPSGAAVMTPLQMRRAGALEGRFIDDRGEPIPRLAVIADRWPLMPTDRSVAPAHSAMTDDLGRFRIHTLPPGRYRVSATPPPPASGGVLFYPGTENPADARIVAIESGQTIAGLDVTVPTSPLSPIAAEVMAAAERDAANAPARPGSSARIAGRVTRNDTGQPIDNAAVEIASIPGAMLSIRRLARTDSNGRFEFARLGGGEYLLTVTAPGYISVDGSLLRPGGGGTRVVVKNGERFDRGDVTLAPTSAIEGRVFDEFGDPAPGVVLQVAQRVYQAGVPRFAPGLRDAVGHTGPTDDRGWFRAYGVFPGDYYLLALPEPFERSRPAGFATTFFPGTASADAATPVHVVAGTDALDVRFGLVTARTTGVSGVVVDAAGRPVPRAQVLLLPTYHGEIRMTAMARMTTAPDGTFTYHDVPEGTYVLQGMGAQQFGSSPVTVPVATDRERVPVALRLRPLTTARGRVVFEGTAPTPRDLKSVTIGFQPTDFTNGPVGSNRIASTINTDWTFEIPNLAWHGLLRATGPTGWAFARVRLDGRDITDTPYDFQSADVNGLEIVLTSRLGAVSVTVVSGSQRIPNSVVWIFPADNAAGADPSRLHAAGRTKADGTLILGGLPEGRYLAVALSPDKRPADPDAILALRSIATPLVVSEGGHATLVLTLVR